MWIVPAEPPIVNSALASMMPLCLARYRAWQSSPVDEEDIDGLSPPPDAQRVAARILCLATVGAMGDVAIDLEQGRTEPQEADEFLAKLREWRQAEGLTELYSSVERSLIDRPPSTWTPQEVVNATWRQESIGVLLWALSDYEELPPYDSEFANVAEVVPVLASTEQFVTHAVLRPADEIERARDVAELWHWRSRTTQLQNASDAYASVREEHDLEAIVRDAATHAYEQGDIGHPIGGDFPFFGKAYRELTDDEYARATSIAMERHFALNWLCGYSEDWDETPTDT